mgnify:FL=1|jgi:hypothetical protein
MQLYPLTSESVATPEAVVEQSPSEVAVRTFCVVWRTGGTEGPLWKADVVAESAFDAARSVVYDRSIHQEQILGVIDRSTIR